MNQATHINSLIFQSLKVLKNQREYISESEFKRILNLNDKEYESLLPFLIKNARIEYKDSSLRFKPLYNIGNYAELSNHLREKYLEYINLDDIKNPSITINETCSCENEVVFIKTKSNTILFYNDFIFSRSLEEIRDLWHSTDL
jgi:hypothetical protein